MVSKAKLSRVRSKVGRLGGAAGVGPAKRRGSKALYRKLAKLSWVNRKPPPPPE